MAEKINAKCAICGKGYHKCLSCAHEVKSTPWKKHTDTSEHYKIFQVISGYTAGLYTKEEAKERLQNIDLSDLDELRDNIKKIIKDITKENKKAIEVADISVVEVEAERPSYMSRRKKYSKPEPEMVEAEVAVATE